MHSEETAQILKKNLLWAALYMPLGRLMSVRLNKRRSEAPRIQTSLRQARCIQFLDLPFSSAIYEGDF